MPVGKIAMQQPTHQHTDRKYHQQKQSTRKRKGPKQKLYLDDSEVLDNKKQCDYCQYQSDYFFKLHTFPFSDKGDPRLPGAFGFLSQDLFLQS